jgi:formate/nitrite transporter FocA (FNT family)
MRYDVPVSDRSELPQLVTEMVDVSKEYIKAEVIAPVRRLGGVSAKSVLAGVLFATGGFLLAIAGLRYAAAVAPDSDLWQIGVRAMFAIGLLIVVAAGSWMVKK